MIDEKEIEALTRCFPAHAGVTPAHAGGWPLRLQVELEIGSELFVTRFMRMGDRRGEVVLALERPSGRLLLHRKAHYGDDTYRLLTGGIGHDEAVATAAVRESAEETGLQVEIRRLVAVIDSTLRFGDIRLPFVSYVMHVVEAGGQLSPDSHEVAGFREVWPGDLPSIAEQLRAIPGERGYWGRWRAVAHDVVAEYLANGQLGIGNCQWLMPEAEVNQESDSFPPSGIDNSQFPIPN